MKYKFLNLRFSKKNQQTLIKEEKLKNEYLKYIKIFPCRDNIIYLVHLVQYIYLIIIIIKNVYQNPYQVYKVKLVHWYKI